MERKIREDLERKIREDLEQTKREKIAFGRVWRILWRIFFLVTGIVGVVALVFFVFGEAGIGGGIVGIFAVMAAFWFVLNMKMDEIKKDLNVIEYYLIIKESEIKEEMRDKKS